ncbi:endonuclease domain-containing protein [Oharaeibacter diazotrophicus]|nr:hypothetical protein GCM10007904_32810 [Oharaeibacter diazotrophicus]
MRSIPGWGGFHPRAGDFFREGLAMPRTSIDSVTRDRARRLRADMTGHEVLLWTKLRDLRPYGANFRRQAPIGPYIADFAWLAGRLVIELDGDHHGHDDGAKDRVRDAWLESRGFEVLRFWNNELTENLDGVLDTIFQKIVEHGADPTPPAVPAVDPPRKGEGSGSRLPRRKPKG